jgi:transposase-like protein
MTKQKRHFSSQEKASLVKRHIKGEAVSALCEEASIHVTTFYGWMEHVLNNLDKAFSKDESKQMTRLNEEKRALEATITQKDSVLVELLGEYMTVKKKHGGASTRFG